MMKLERSRSAPCSGSVFRRIRLATVAAGAVAVAVGGVGLPRLGFGLGQSEAYAQAAPVPAVAPASALRPASLRLISQSQYVNSINRIFGRDIAVKIRFAAVKRVDGLLGVGASTAVLTSGAFDPLDATARAIATQVVDPAHRDFLMPCKPANPAAADPACAKAFFSRIAPMVYRRPPSEAELDGIVRAAGQSVGEAGDFYAGIAYALSGILVSPQFLFILERSEADPANPGASRLDGYSKASRLSFLLWNSAPDAELLAAAGRGELHDPAGLKRQVDRMIGSPLFVDGVRGFFNDFLVLEAFDNLSKDATIYPAFSLKAVEESREQILRTVVNHLVTRHGDYRDLFTTRRVMMSSELAVLYRLPVNVGSIGWVPYEFPQDDPRTGLLTQIGFLAQYAHPGRSSATRRGRGIREVLLCQHVPDPPPNVDFSNFENPASPMPTARQRLSAHNENPVCAGCHRVTDPIGLALENFDGAGQFRATERNAQIDPSGALDGIQFSDPAGFGKALRDNPSLKSCVVNRLYAYSVGQQTGDGDAPLLANYEATLDKRGYRFDEMLRLIVLDKSFFAVRPAETAALAPTILASGGGSNAH